MDKAEHDLSMSLVSLRSSKSSGGFSPDKSGALPSIKTPKHNDSKDGGYAPSLFRFQRRLSSVQLLPLGPHPKIDPPLYSDPWPCLPGGVTIKAGRLFQGTGFADETGNGLGLIIPTRSIVPTGVLGDLRRGQCTTHR
eukprot:594422-Prorocentrum_minimum.AAC.6